MRSILRAIYNNINYFQVINVGLEIHKGRNRGSIHLVISNINFSETRINMQ